MLRILYDDFDQKVKNIYKKSVYCEGLKANFLLIFDKRGSRGAAHAAESLRWSVKLLLKYLIRTINISAYRNIHV